MSTLVSITLPKLGESVADATIISWLKNPGDFIAKDEMIAEVATDKVDTDLPCEFEGTLKEILVPAGEVALVGAPIAVIEVEGDVKPTAKKETTVPKVANAQTNAVSQTKNNEVHSQFPKHLSPVVRNIAAQAGLSPEDLKKIPASGSGQTRITKQDILHYLNPPKATEVAKSNPKKDLPIHVGDEVIALPRMRKLIGQHMTQSIQTIPHVTTFAQIDVTALVAYREAHKEQWQKQKGVKVTYTHLIMEAVIKALQAFPKLNAWMNGDDEFILKKDINLGFAAATPDENLIVPNIKAVQQYDVFGIAKEVSRLGNAAKTKKLKASDIEQTTFTVSNTGIYGSMMGTPIISIPQVAILALGEIASGPAVVIENGEEKLAIRKLMHVSISYDHRVIDGAYASQFLKALKEIIEAV